MEEQSWGVDSWKGTVFNFNSGIRISFSEKKTVEQSLEEDITPCAHSS